MFTYYKKEEREEHALYASEIAEFFELYVGKGSNPHSRFVSAYLNDKIDKNGGSHYYYMTSRGKFNQVFFAGDNTLNMLKDVLSSYENNNVKDSVVIKVGDTNFTINAIHHNYWKEILERCSTT